MASPRPSIQLFYDVVSPYSYVAYVILQRYKAVWNVDVQLSPFYLGGVMKAAGNSPPGMLPVRAKFMGADMRRSSEILGIKMKLWPDKFPVNTIKAMRFCTFLKLNHPDKLDAANQALWKALWGEGKDISNETILEQSLSDALGADFVNPILKEHVNNDSIKAELQATTELAISLGAYGAPVMIVRPQGGTSGSGTFIFGSDRFEHIAYILKKPYLGMNPSSSATANL